MHDPDDEMQDFDPQRLETEWLGLNALREILSIAVKGQATPTYEQALRLAEELAPGLFGRHISLIAAAQEPNILREYRQRAEAASQLSNREVAPLEIVSREIEEAEAMLRTAGERDRIQSRLFRLEAIRRQLRDREYTENQIIIHDVLKAERPELPQPPIDTDTYREYRLPYDRGLRIRLLHPDKPEHVIGADVIYEIVSDRAALARLTLLQYKVWNGRTLYLSESPNIVKQLQRLQSSSCDFGLCSHPDEDLPPSDPSSYRLPHCAGFVRLTDKLQDPSSRLVSRGLHVPLCIFRKITEPTGRGGEKIEKRNLDGRAVSQRIFEEMFNRNMLGSRWISYAEVEELYRKARILDADERLIIHAQEFKIAK